MFKVQLTGKKSNNIVEVLRKDIRRKKFSSYISNYIPCNIGQYCHIGPDIKGFIGFMNTPILKAKKGVNELKFYNDGEWANWCNNNDSAGWKVKYYKGLGTSTSKEFKQYFAEKKIVNFVKTGEECINSIDMVFNKQRADDRKT